MTDHFAKAEQLLARIDSGEVAPPFIKGMTSRALVHAQLAIAQAISHNSGCCEDCGDYFTPGDTSGEYARNRDGDYLPVRTIETRGDIL